MKIADTCTRHVVTAAANATLAEVARLMRNQHVGSVIIVDGTNRPVGIVTDRDIVIETTACGIDARSGPLRSCHRHVACRGFIRGYRLGWPLLTT